MTGKHTTLEELEREIKRQQARLNFMTDPQSRQILSASIIDLIKLTKVYPNTVWAADLSKEN